MEDKITFFKSFYLTFKKLRTNDEKAEYIEGLLAFAFEGIEPDFEEGSNLDFAFTNQRDNIEATRKRARTSRENGSQHTGKPNEKPTGEPSEKPTRKPTGKPNGKPNTEPKPIQDKDRDKDRDRDRDMEKEGEKNFSLEKNSSPSDSVGASARSAPPESAECPTCGVSMEPTNSFSSGRRRRVYRCPLCEDTAEVAVA